MRWLNASLRFLFSKQEREGRRLFREFYKVIHRDDLITLVLANGGFVHATEEGPLFIHLKDLQNNELLIKSHVQGQYYANRYRHLLIEEVFRSS